MAKLYQLEIDNFKEGVHMKADLETFRFIRTAKDAPLGAPQHDEAKPEFHIEFEGEDKWRDTLWRAINEGRTLPVVRILICLSMGGNKVFKASYIFSEVRPTSYQTSGSNGSYIIPHIFMSFSYNKMTYKDG